MQRINDLIPAAIQPSQAPAKQECRPLRTTEQQQVETALQGKVLRHSTEEEMKKALRYIYVLVGLRAHNFPVGEEKQLLHAFIFKNYGGHTPEEIKLAWDLAIMQKLNLKPENVICYENFTIAYFALIMEAYREWAREQIKLLPAPVITRQLTAMEKVDINLVWALKCLNEINKLPVIYDGKTRKANKQNLLRL
jgi:hypothetical protein